MKCLITYLFILYISCVLPQAGERRIREITVVTTLDDNGDASKSASELVLEAGFSFDEHKVTTKDGYILTLWRVYKKKGGPAVILQHGILDDGYSFLLSGIRHSIVTYLVKKGYDVWIGNSRGQFYSLDHVEGYTWYNPLSKYWDFSFHEMGIYDFPATIRYVKNVTGQAKVGYIGHSQGAAHYFVQSSVDPTFINENVGAFVGIGPAIFVQPHESQVINLLAQKLPLFDFMHYFGANFFWVLPEKILSLFEPLCRNYPRLYYSIVPHIGGHTLKQKFDLRRWPALCTKHPGGTSTKTLLHWMQIIRAGGRFQMFDYGYEKNMEIYNQETPKEYDLGKLKEVTVPTLIISGTKDAIISESSIQKLLNTLKNHEKDQMLEIIKLDDYSHMDFAWGKDSIKEVYPHIDRFIKRASRRQI